MHGIAHNYFVYKKQDTIQGVKLVAILKKKAFQIPKTFSIVIVLYSKSLLLIGTIQQLLLSL